MRARHDPVSRTAQRALRAERRATAAPRRLEPPLGALDQNGRLDELQRMHHGLHLAAPDLLRAAALGERADRSDGLAVRLLLADRLEVAIEPPELGRELLLRPRAPRGHPLRRLLA